MTKNSNKKRSGVLTGLVIGGAVGSVLSFLLTTDEGKNATKKVSKSLKKNGLELLKSFKKKKNKDDIS